jgi:hypothetical protein
MREVCAVVGNRDIEPFIPVLVSCIARPAEVPDCVHKLGATTFVQVGGAHALTHLTLCSAAPSLVPCLGYVIKVVLMPTQCHSPLPASG